MLAKCLIEQLIASDDYEELTLRSCPGIHVDPSIESYKKPILLFYSSYSFVLQIHKYPFFFINTDMSVLVVTIRRYIMSRKDYIVSLSQHKFYTVQRKCESLLLIMNVQTNHQKNMFLQNFSRCQNELMIYFQQLD